jgi:hypothetical protein
MTHWPAVRIHCSLKRLPPQKYLPSAVYLYIAACHGNCPGLATCPPTILASEFNKIIIFAGLVAEIPTWFGIW